MLLSKANLVVVKVAGTDKKDPVLHQVHIEDDGTTVASDGSVMMAVEPLEAAGRGRPAALPEFADEDEIPDGGVGVVPEVIIETIKNLPRGALGLELGFACVTKCLSGEGEEDGDSGGARSIELTTTDLNKKLKVEGRLSGSTLCQ